jgi:hypothetical protein
MEDNVLIGSMGQVALPKREVSEWVDGLGSIMK